MSTINIQPVVSANGETILAVSTETALYTCLLGPDFLMKMVEKNAQGSRIMGYGGVKLYDAGSFKMQNEGYENNHLHIYFYNSNGNEPAKFGGRLPSFMNADMSVNTADITAVCSNKTETTQITSTKEGLVKERMGDLNLFGSLCGITCYWPQGYGTGEFDSMCVSLVDLETYKDDTSITDYTYRKPIFGGVCFGVGNTTVANTTILSYIRNGVSGITDENTLLLKFRGRAGLWDYNLITGDLVQSQSTYDGYMGVWGKAQYVMNGILYGLTTGEAVSGAENNSTYYLFSYNTADGTSTLGTTCTYYNEQTNILKVGSELYLQDDGRFSFTSTSTTYAPKYYKINLETTSQTTTQLTITVPTYLKTCYCIVSGDTDGEYYLTDLKNLITYKFTDLSNIETTITEPLFVNGGQPFSVGETVMWMAANEAGFYYQTQAAGNAYSNVFRNQGYTGCKYSLLSGEIGPLLSYGKFSKVYEKPADTDFTSNFYLTLTAVNTVPAEI